jgi:hypothetical protein
MSSEAIWRLHEQSDDFAALSNCHLLAVEQHGLNLWKRGSQLPDRGAIHVNPK